MWMCYNAVIERSEEVLLFRWISCPSRSTAMTTPCRCMPSASDRISILFIQLRTSTFQYLRIMERPRSRELARASSWMSSVFCRPNDSKPSSSALVLVLDQPSVAMPRSQPVSMKPVVVLPPRRSCQLSQHFNGQPSRAWLFTTKMIKDHWIT